MPELSRHSEVPRVESALCDEPVILRFPRTNAQERFVASQTQLKIMDNLFEFPGMTGDDIADKIGVSRRTVHRAVRELIAGNIIGHHKRTGFYLLSNPPPELRDDEPQELPVERRFVANAMQRAILDALNGKALRTDALAHKADVNRRSLFKKTGGLQELKEQGLVSWHQRLGYFRPDALPTELA